MPNQEDIRKAGAAAAQAARESRSQQPTQRQNVISQVAGEMRHVAAAMSPEIAASMGSALDPTQGYDFDPKSGRPADLPQPGTAPGGYQRAPTGRDIFSGKQIGDLMGQENPGLPDDHDELVGQTSIPPPSQSQARHPPQQPQYIEAPKTEHPILASLRRDFGLDEIKPQDAEVGGHKWTFHMLTSADLARASRIADLSDTLTERQLVFQMAIVAHAIAAIDGVPAYQVFNTEPPPGVAIVDHLRPPKQVRYLNAAKIFDWLNDNTRTQLPDKLYKAYEDKCDPQSAVSSYLDDPHNRRVRFRCTEEDCDHELFILPKTRPGTRDIWLPFCRWHGCPMEVVAAEGEDSPLP